MEGETIPNYNKGKVERDNYKQFISALEGMGCYDNQLPYEKTGTKKWAIRKGMPWPTRALENGNYPFCLLSNGEIYITRRPRPHTNANHPELVKGQPVVTAGILKWNDGEVIRVSNESGHYLPSVESIDAMMLAMRFWRVPISEKVEIRQWLHG